MRVRGGRLRLAPPWAGWRWFLDYPQATRREIVKLIRLTIAEAMTPELQAYIDTNYGMIPSSVLERVRVRLPDLVLHDLQWLRQGALIWIHPGDRGRAARRRGKSLRHRRRRRGLHRARSR